MECARRICEDLYWVGGNDRRIQLFENVYLVPDGVSYNAYLCMDEKTVLLDTVDRSVSEVFLENLEAVLDGRPLDYVIVNHMEPDHAATLAETARRWPQAVLVMNDKTLRMAKQFFSFDVQRRALLVKEGDTLCTGRHTFTFVMAPMVHWPEVMVTYDTASRALFSADAFGTFGALSGNLFADEMDFPGQWLAEARRYYTNIVGKYGAQVQALLKKAAGLQIEYLCPLHGPVWRENIGWFVEKYRRWSSYTPEDETVALFYASVYGGTENAAELVAARLAERGVRGLRMYDVSKTDVSYLIAEAFRCSHLVLASATYNGGIFVRMENLLHDLAAHNLQNRTVALVENGSWAPTAAGLMSKLLAGCKNLTVLTPPVTVRSTVKPDDRQALTALADAVADSLPQPAARTAPTVPTVEVTAAPKAAAVPDTRALNKISCGLFVLSARRGEQDNGCIINTVEQVSSQPARISIAVSRANLTREMIAETGCFNLSVLSTQAPFELFSHFGFQSGRDTDKFAGWAASARSRNGLLYLTMCTNAYLSARVVAVQELETHTVFLAQVTQAEVLSDAPSMTYDWYHAQVKPQPQPAPEKKTGFVCTVCGYVYEGETLPDDFVCPLCKHGKEAFEPLR